MTPFDLLRALFRWTRGCLLLVLCLLCLSTVAGLVLFRGPIYNRIFKYPKMERALEELRAQREEPPSREQWREFRGVAHSHSEISHDSQVPFTEILTATQEAGLDFILMSDHCPEGVGDFSLQWREIRDGVLFVPGFETSSGFLVWGLPSGTQLDCKLDPPELAAAVAALGGTMMFAHTEEERPYELTEVAGMEIYNIHTDIMGDRIPEVLGETLITSRRFPDLSLYSIFDRQEAMVARWDAENRSRKFAGIAANDAHQNVGVHLLCTDNNRLALNVNSGDELFGLPVGPLGPLFRRLSRGSVEGELFRLVLDPYARSLRFVNMHVLAAELSEEAILEALTLGRSYISFNVLADAGGFLFHARGPAGTAVMGEALPFSEDTVIEAYSPLPCRFRLFQEGQVIAEGEGRDFQHTAPAPGKFRLEAELRVADEWLLWVQTNPLRLEEF